jgi:4-hydroxybenzoate polyprenyltransferase
MFRNRNCLIVSVLYGAFSAAIFIVLLTIGGEQFPTLKGFLKDTHYHHWIGKGIWAGILFIVVTIALYVYKRDSDSSLDIAKATRLLSYGLIFGTVILFAFFTYEYIAHH